MSDVTMPQLSDSMEEGLVLQWLISEGDPVAEGQDLVEIETDKATMTYTSEFAGALEIVVAEGETVAVGELIARVGSGGEGGAKAEEPVAETAPAPEAPAVEAAVVTAAPPAAPKANGASADGGGTAVLTTPLARRIAQAQGLSLAELTGSGPRGRITKADVLAAAGLPSTGASSASRPGAPALTPAQTADSSASRPGPAGEGTRTEELSRLQQLIATRMTEAKATVPHFQVQTEVVMDAVIAARSRFKAMAREGETVPSLNDVIVKACAVALRNHPHANGSYIDGRFVLHERVNVGVAVAADDALVVPVVFDADTKSLSEIARETRRLAERVRTGEITPPELSSGTFTVSNLGMFGMTAITPVINPPQAAILGVGATREVLARAGGEIVDRSLLTLNLSCDHRILYGADAAQFLAEIRAVLEVPLKMAL